MQEHEKKYGSFHHLDLQANSASPPTKGNGMLSPMICNEEYKRQQKVMVRQVYVFFFGGSIKEGRSG
ncbi:hypothetical protein L1987_11057 [Smallanthus sonchifolius]|uniref:Uncharacterized protein n=1 Tax=Smallanthus sonchifolius TaxID=185202 RepID=A0ACB9J9X0_9ASTR|nr:hypothetical protein L1987_11057 [Smallanthus sonchifolius]